MNSLPILHHTDDCESCRKSADLRLATLIIEGIQVLLAVVAVVVVAYAIYAVFFRGGA